MNDPAPPSVLLGQIHKTESQISELLGDLASRLAGAEEERPPRKQRTLTQKLPAKAVHSPYLTAEEAAQYLRITLNALYGLVERRRLKPLPRSRRYRFTVEQLDAYLRGEKP